MDRARPQSKSRQIKRAVIIAAVAALLISGGVTLANIDFATYRVERNKLGIETVRQGTMEIKIAANGQLLSKHIEQLSAQISGRVAQTNVKPGAVVQVGRLLVELTNQPVAAQAEEAQSAWEGAKAEQEAEQSDLETRLLSQEALLLQVQFDLEKARVKAEADKALAADKLVSEIDLRRSELDLNQLTKTYAIETQRLQKIRDNIQVQMAVKKARVTQLARAWDRNRTLAASLKIIAGISGIVQAINVEVGQQVQPGSPIGRIAQLDQLYAELKVPAREATQVQAGQPVIVDTRNGTVNGIVTRVDPGVTEGTVVVDVDLQGALPAGARPQLQVEGTVFISRLPNTLFVGKPSYVKNDAKIAVYKLDPAGHYATRVTITAGKVSLNYLQVLEGLRAGDRIITSDTAEWQGQERILLR